VSLFDVRLFCRNFDRLSGSQFILAHVRVAVTNRRSRSKVFLKALNMSVRLTLMDVLSIFSQFCTVSRQQLVPWLQNQIAEQKRIDIATSGAPVVSHSIHSIQHPPTSGKDTSDLQLLLPQDAKKQRKQVKQLFLDRGVFGNTTISIYPVHLTIIPPTAFQTGVQIKTAVQSGLPTLAIDVTQTIFDAMTKNSAWVTEEDAWKPILASFSNQQALYAQQVREAAAKRKAEGCHYILLFAVREERVHLLALS
jgi:eukaryotic translation initiation factor 2-alpha kinase 4